MLIAPFSFETTMVTGMPSTTLRARASKRRTSYDGSTAQLKIASCWPITMRFSAESTSARSAVSLGLSPSHFGSPFMVFGSGGRLQPESERSALETSRGSRVPDTRPVFA